MKVFRPETDGSGLVSEDKQKITLTPHLVFAATDPICSFLSSGRTHGQTKLKVYHGVRLDAPIEIEGVTMSVIRDEHEATVQGLRGHQKFASGGNEKWKGFVLTSRNILPAGSMILRTFGKNDAGQYEWFGLTRKQEVLQNIQRIAHDGVSAEVLDPWSLSIAAGSFEVERFMTRMDAPDQFEAHMQDALLVERIFPSRAISPVLIRAVLER